jgi:hypothetical protein
VAFITIGGVKRIPHQHRLIIGLVEMNITAILTAEMTSLAIAKSNWQEGDYLTEQAANSPHPQASEETPAGGDKFPAFQQTENKGFNSTTVPNLTEPSSSDHDGLSKPLDQG